MKPPFPSRRLLVTTATLITVLIMTLVSSLEVSPVNAQAAPAMPPTITETQWNLIELDGAPVNSASPESRPYIYLHAEGDKLSGSGGCNRLFSSFDLSGTSLQFHAVASTRMACPGNVMEHEPALLDALKLVTGFQITADTLILHVDDRVLARFEAEKKK